MNPIRRLFPLLVAAIFAATAAPAFAQAPKPMPYPVRVVILVTHSSPGAGSDVMLREMIKYLQRYIATNFIVENIDGGSGAKAVSRVAAAKPDGSVLYATTPTYILTSLMSRPANTYKDLEPVVNFFTDSEMVYTRVESPYKTLNDVLDRARKARGRWGASNPASLERESLEELKIAAKVNAAVVSHNGGADMMINVLNGTLDMGVGETEEIRAQLDGRKIRLLATFNAARMTAYPEVPTVKELGYDVTLQKFRGIAGPKGLPPDVVKIWNEAAKLMLADPEYKKLYEEEVLVPNYIPHDQYGLFITDFATKTEAYLKSTGVIK
jgi:tripartite-type tricarboxylate transporter receptor subunit TctC